MSFIELTVLMLLNVEVMAVYKNDLIEKYEAFEMEDDPVKKAELKAEVLDFLNRLERPDSDDFHIWGLTYYMSEEDKELNRKLALDKFLQAIKLEDSNFLSCLYAAHCYHDLKVWENALKYYELVNKEMLQDFQFWRYVKLLEQIAYCNYKMGKQELGRRQFLEVLRFYEEESESRSKLRVVYPKHKREELVTPHELMSCLENLDPIKLRMTQVLDYLADNEQDRGGSILGRLD